MQQKSNLIPVLFSYHAKCNSRLQLNKNKQLCRNFASFDKANCSCRTITYFLKTQRVKEKDNKLGIATSRDYTFNEVNQAFSHT